MGKTGVERVETAVQRTCYLVAVKVFSTRYPQHLAKLWKTACMPALRPVQIRAIAGCSSAANERTAVNRCGAPSF
jgi:hypothetical protein